MAKPSNLSFDQAAAVPIAALTALQAVRDRGKVQPGERVLINGAGGGVGTFTVQIAKAFGGDVTAVSNTGNVELMRSLGADRVVDYSREDFVKGSGRYDVVIDLGGNRSISDLRKVLTPEGRIVLVGAPHFRFFAPLVRIAPRGESGLVSQRRSCCRSSQRTARMTCSCSRSSSSRGR